MPNVELGQLEVAVTLQERGPCVAPLKPENPGASKAVGSISTNPDSLWESKASRSTNLGHVTTSHTGGSKVSPGVLDSSRHPWSP
jgi:hypothetical protein